MPGLRLVSAFQGATACLKAIGNGAVPQLRTQIPIDVARTGSLPRIPNSADLRSFAWLLRAYGASGVVSIRAHDHTVCSSSVQFFAPAADEPSIPSGGFRLNAGESLPSCGYPSPKLYRKLFGEAVNLFAANQIPASRLKWTAWNEPENPDSTLMGIPSATKRTAAIWAGMYWAQAAAQLGTPDSVLAGEFIAPDSAEQASLAGTFINGAGQRPRKWALHTYRDAIEGNATRAQAFINAVAGPNGSTIELWQTETGVKYAGTGLNFSGDKGTLGARGTTVRTGLASANRRLFFYEPLSETGSWDSGLADPTGRGRAFICGLAGLGVEQCSNSVTAFSTADSPAWVGPDGLG